MTTLDPKGIEAAGKAVERSRVYGDAYEGAEAAILAYLQATDTVLVPREATQAMIQKVSEKENIVEDVGPRISGCYYCGFSSLKTVYRAMIQAAEGK